MSDTEFKDYNQTDLSNRYQDHTSEIGYMFDECIYNNFELKYVAFRLTGYAYTSKKEYLKVFETYGFNKFLLPSKRFRIIYEKYKEAKELKKVYIGLGLTRYANKLQAIEVILLHSKNVVDEDLIYHCENNKLKTSKSLKACIEPNCKKRSTFNYIDHVGTIYCSDHAKFEMVNVEKMRKKLKKIKEFDFIYENLEL